MHGKPTYLNPKAKYIWGDVRDKDIVIMALENVDAVYHFAAYQDYSLDFSTFFYVNSVGTALLYEIIVENNLPINKVIVASSQFVQGEGIYRSKDGVLSYPERRTNKQLRSSQWDFLDETGTTLQWQWTDESYANPPNQYAMSKYSQELMALRFGKAYEIPSVVLRYSIVQGARQSLYNTYSGACRIFSLSYYNNKSPVLYEDGLMCRDFINIKDVISANLLMLENDSVQNQVFCVGGGKAYTISEFAKEVATMYELENLLPTVTGEYRYGDTRNACSDISKIKKLGWSPKKTIQDSILEYKDYINEQDNLKYLVEYSKKQMKKMNIIRQTEKQI